MKRRRTVCLTATAGWTALILVSGFASPLGQATAQSVSGPAADSTAAFFTQTLPGAFTGGTFSANVRARYEFVHQNNLPLDAHAGTIRTRFGFTTAPLYGFQGMLEAENVLALDEDAYNAAGANQQPGRPVVADPETTEINQAWLAWTWTNVLSVKAGRQRIVFDNHRFIGDVGWRQNMQTYDAASVRWSPLPRLTLDYAYVWDVRRVFGNVSGLPPANRDFESDSHLIHLSWNAHAAAQLVGYAYLLDLENAAGFNQSCATYGLALTGSTPLTDRLKLEYRAEAARQTDYRRSALDYEASYYALELAGHWSPVILGAGWEQLGSDNGAGFRTPLATLHAFNGWADVFLATPNAGLRDRYGFVQVTLPGQVPVRFVYHKFDSDAGSADFGQEFDVLASRRFGKHWTLLAKYAYYDGRDAPYAFQVHKVWAQVEFNF